jgi:transposase-like protein
MNLLMDDAKNLLARSISDSYGATIGKIVGISTDVRNKVTSIEIELGNGQFLNCQPSQLIVNEKGIILLDDWKLEANALKTELGLALRRLKALSELHRQGDIQPEIYEDFRRNHDESLNDLEARREALTKKLTSVIARLDQQIRELETFLANNKMQLAAGEIDPQAYKIATDSIERGLSRAFSAKRDAEEILRSTSALRSSRLDDRLQPIKLESATVRDDLPGAEILLLPKFVDTSPSKR